MYKLAIDIGTTTLKCVLFGDKLKAVAQAVREYPVSYPVQSWAEQDPEDWFGGVSQAIKEVLSKSGVDPARIKAVGVSGQTPCLLPLDEYGRPLRKAIIWMDRRASAECGEFLQRVDNDTVRRITGKSADAQHLPVKYMWFERHEPELLKKTRMFLQANGYITYRLTGEYTVDRGNAATALIYDINTGDYAYELLKAAGLDPSLLPKIFDGDGIAGYVTKQAAAETGLQAGTPVIAGHVDASAAGIEAGVFSEGLAFEATGTSSVFMMPLNRIMLVDGLSTGVGLGKGRSTLFAAMSTTGASYKWFRDALMGGENEDGTKYVIMDKMILRDAPKPGNLIFLPYMMGERSPIWNSDARGVFFGLSMNTNAAEMMRAVLEGASFALRDNMEMAKRVGASIDKLRVSGGCAKSDIWLKIKASVINVPIEVPKVSFGAPAGLAIMMMPAIGEYESIEKAAADCVEITKTVLPDPEWAAHYDEMFKIYKSVYEHTIDDFAALSKLLRNQ
ncbi:MAG: FGGY-family carbohydrate kinase [Clostridia bacterium]|nr:FGGY-family carbohydrate kinase [Clostridia bacterium]